MDVQRPEVVVITGASAGIGRATARVFARHGAQIGLIARDRERLEATRDEVHRLGGRALVLPLDVADAHAVGAAASNVESVFGPIDIWINGAAVMLNALAVDTTPDEYRRVMEVNYLGAVHGTLAALEQMLPRDKGTILNIGSVEAYRAFPLHAAYAASKQALSGFSDALRAELIHQHSRVHVAAVHLPSINTPLFQWSRSKLERELKPYPPVFQPEVPAEAIYWMAHHRRRELWVTGAAAMMIMAQKLMPALTDLFVGRTAVEGQQEDRPAEPNRPDNLYEPVLGDYAARGEYAASAVSPHVWASTHRGLMAGLAGVAVLGAVAAFRTRSSRRSAIPRERALVPEDQTPPTLSELAPEDESGALVPPPERDDDALAYAL